MVMKTPVHPGEILREDVLADLGLSVGEAASRLGISRVTLSRVLHGHARVSPNLAVRLEEAGVGTARAWLAMQSAHDLAAERAAGLPTVRKLDPSPDDPCNCEIGISPLDIARLLHEPETSEASPSVWPCQRHIRSAHVTGSIPVRPTTRKCAPQGGTNFLNLHGLHSVPNTCPIHWDQPPPPPHLSGVTLG